MSDNCLYIKVSFNVVGITFQDDFKWNKHFFLCHFGGCHVWGEVLPPSHHTHTVTNSTLKAVLVYQQEKSMKKMRLSSTTIATNTNSRNCNEQNEMYPHVILTLKSHKFTAWLLPISWKKRLINEMTFFNPHLQIAMAFDWAKEYI